MRPRFGAYEGLTLVFVVALAALLVISQPVVDVVLGLVVSLAAGLLVGAAVGRGSRTLELVTCCLASTLALGVLGGLLIWFAGFEVSKPAWLAVLGLAVAVSFGSRLFARRGSTGDRRTPSAEEGSASDEARTEDLRADQDTREAAPGEDRADARRRSVSLRGMGVFPALVAALLVAGILLTLGSVNNGTDQATTQLWVVPDAGTPTAPAPTATVGVESHEPRDAAFSVVEYTPRGKRISAFRLAPGQSWRQQIPAGPTLVELYLDGAGPRAYRQVSTARPVYN